MEGLVQPDRLRARILLWAREEAELGLLPAKSVAILGALLYRGELPRAEVGDIAGTGKRQASRFISALAGRGMLTSDTPYGPVHAGCRACFPSSVSRISRTLHVGWSFFARKAAAIVGECVKDTRMLRMLHRGVVRHLVDTGVKVATDAATAIAYVGAFAGLVGGGVALFNSWKAVQWKRAELANTYLKDFNNNPELVFAGRCLDWYAGKLALPENLRSYMPDDAKIIQHDRKIFAKALDPYLSSDGLNDDPRIQIYRTAIDSFLSWLCLVAIFQDRSETTVGRYLDFEGTSYRFNSETNAADVEKLRLRQEGG